MAVLGKKLFSALCNPMKKKHDSCLMKLRR